MAVNPLSQLNDWTFRRVVWATLILVIVAFAFWAVYQFSAVVITVFVAIVLGTVMRPAVAWLHRRGLPRLAGIVLIFILMLAFLIGFLFL